MNVDSFLVGITKQGKQVYFDLLTDGVQHSINIYEDLVFCGVYLEGKKVTFPNTAIQKTFFNSFSSEERNLIGSEFFDERLLTANDYRKQNTVFTYTLSLEPGVGVATSNVNVVQSIPLTVLKHDVDVKTMPLVRLYSKFAIPLFLDSSYKTAFDGVFARTFLSVDLKSQNQDLFTQVFLNVASPLSTDQDTYPTVSTINNGNAPADLIFYLGDFYIKLIPDYTKFPDQVQFDKRLLLQIDLYPEINYFVLSYYQNNAGAVWTNSKLLQQHVTIGANGMLVVTSPLQDLVIKISKDYIV